MLPVDQCLINSLEPFLMRPGCGLFNNLSRIFIINRNAISTGPKRPPLEEDTQSTVLDRYLWLSSMQCTLPQDSNAPSRGHCCLKSTCRNQFSCRSIDRSVASSSPVRPYSLGAFRLWLEFRGKVINSCILIMQRCHASDRRFGYRVVSRPVTWSQLGLLPI